MLTELSRNFVEDRAETHSGFVDSTGRERDRSEVSPAPRIVSEVTHPDIAPLAFLVGTWRGTGHGSYPTIAPFDYTEEVTFAALPKPVLAYHQRTRRAGTEEPLHAEMGYVRLVDGVPELVICQPTGLVEAHRGQMTARSLVFECDAVGATASAAVHDVTAVRRELTVDDHRLSYVLSMGAVGQPLQVHLRATLRRADA